ncbi:uncharacterized protein LOC135622645 [Musa acuminata AAA Group]|uniref:uncharacterized protein LOC103997102 n=1 Tax=Musa acuminata AAA Group TaxID=214697 RepID=UPI0031D7544D
MPLAKLSMTLPLQALYNLMEPCHVITSRLASSPFSSFCAHMEAAGDREPWEAALDDATLDVLTEIDGTLQMELSDDKHGEEADDDRLGPVIRSLEAEISAAAAAAAGSVAGCSNGDTMLESGHHHEDCEDCRLDDILSGPDSHGCSTSSTYLVEDPFGWVEMEAAGVGSPCSDLVDWYADECISDQVGVVGHGEARCHSTSYYSEQYTSLWE